MITLSHVTFRYSGQTQWTLKNISLNIERGESVLILGRNGAGKSTLLRHCNGLLSPSGGSVVVNGHDTRKTKTSRLAAEVALCLQDPMDQLFCRTVRDEVLAGPQALGRHESRRLAAEALSLVGLQGAAEIHPYELGHAGRKLLQIACAAAMGSPAVVLDEPTSGMHYIEKEKCISALDQLHAAGRMLMIVTHDIDTFLPLCSRVIIMEDGAIAFDGKRKSFVSNPTFVKILRRVGLSVPVAYRFARHCRLAPTVCIHEVAAGLSAIGE